MTASWFKAYCLATALLCVSAAQAEVPRVLLQADFETDPWKAGWTPWGQGTYGQNLLWSEEGPQGGKRSLAVVPNPPQWPDAGWESPPFRVTPGKNYRVTLSARAEHSTYWFLMFYDRNGALVEGDVSVAIEPSKEWKAYEGVYRAKFPCHTATFVFYTVGNAPMAVDDVKIQESSDAEALEIADRVWAEMPHPSYAPPANVAERLPRTLAKLKQGKPLSVVLLGDSIANDLSNSPYAVLWQRAFPGTEVRSQFSGRGGTGWLKHQHQLEQRVLQHQPDLLILLAVSNDASILAELLNGVLDKLDNESPQTEILLITPHLHGWYGTINPGGEQREVLLQIASERQLAMLDLLTVWDDYLKSIDKEPAYLLRDGIHMNNRGRELSARVLTDYLEAATTSAPQSSR